MEKIRISDLKPGMVTTEPVITKRGQELIPTGTTLTKQLISRMEFYSIESASIDEASILTEEEIQAALQAAMAQKLGRSMKETKPEEPKPEVSSPKNEVAYSQKVKQSKTFQEYSLHSSIVTEMLREQLEGFVFEKKPMDFDKMLSGVKSLITPRTDGDPVF